MKKVRVKKPIAKKPVVGKPVSSPVLNKGVEPVITDFSIPGFSNTLPGSPQSIPYQRSEPLPSQVNKVESKSL